MEKAILIKGHGPAFLRDAMAAGLVAGDMEAEVARTLAANERLEHENAMLRGVAARNQAQAAERRGYVLRLLERDAKRRWQMDENHMYRLGFLVLGLCVGAAAAAWVMWLGVSA